MSNTTWGNRVIPLSSPEQNIYPVGAAIGPGFQFGIGAAFGSGGRKTVAITGDGGFYLNMTKRSPTSPSSSSTTQATASSRTSRTSSMASAITSPIRSDPT